MIYLHILLDLPIPSVKAPKKSTEKGSPREACRRGVLDRAEQSRVANTPACIEREPVLLSGREREKCRQAGIHVLANQRERQLREGAEKGRREEEKEEFAKKKKKGSCASSRERRRLLRRKASYFRVDFSSVQELVESSILLPGGDDL